jgi:hypothetical protein
MPFTGGEGTVWVCLSGRRSAHLLAHERVPINRREEWVLPQRRDTALTHLEVKHDDLSKQVLERRRTELCAEERGREAWSRRRRGGDKSVARETQITYGGRHSLRGGTWSCTV